MAETISMRRSLRIEWKVENIFSMYRVRTEAFYIGSSRCYFLLQPYETEETERIAIYMIRKNSDRGPFNGIRVDIFIEDRNGKPQFPMGRSSRGGDLVVWTESMSELRREEIVSTIGDVKFVCVLVLESEVESERDVSTQTDANAEPVISLACLSLDFHQLLDDNLLSDVTLKCGDRSIPVHRTILSARSDVFLAMLNGDTPESRKGVIEISDVEPSTLDQLLQYIYSGKVSELSVDSAQQLYAAADKYAIDSLRLSCGNFLKDNLTEENACSVLALADAHDDKSIKDCALSFIMETELLREEYHWLKFLKEHPKLATEVLHHMYREICSSKCCLTDKE